MRNPDPRDPRGAQVYKPNNTGNLFEETRQNPSTPGLFGQDDVPATNNTPDPFAQESPAPPAPSSTQVAGSFHAPAHDPFAAEGARLKPRPTPAKDKTPAAKPARDRPAAPSAKPAAPLTKRPQPAHAKTPPPATLPQDPPAAALPKTTPSYKKGSLKEGGLPASGHKKPSKPKKNGVNSKKRLQLNILIASLIGVVILAVLFAAIVPGCTQTPVSSGVTPSQPASSSTLAAEAGYDKNANSLPTGKYEGTLLQKSTDAGASYVDDTLFLGDSNTARMLLYGDISNVSLNNCLGVVGMGIQGALYEKCARFSGYKNDLTMIQAVEVLQPRRIVITFGTNNAPSNQVSSFIESYEEVVAALQEAYPAADIIIGAVPPIDQFHINENLNMTTIDKYNVALLEMSNTLNLKFLNWTEELKDNSTGFAKSGYTVKDGIHLSETGMQALFTYLRTHSYVTNDKRPKPLNPIPNRVEIPKPVVVPVSKAAPVAPPPAPVVSTPPPVSLAPPPSTAPVSIAPPPSSTAPVSIAPPPVISTPPPAPLPPDEGEQPPPIPPPGDVEAPVPDPEPLPPEGGELGPAG